MNNTNDASYKIIRDNKNYMMNFFQGDVIYYCKSILTGEELTLIYEKKSESEQIELFLEFLATKPYADLTPFFNHLKEWYIWVYEVLNIPQRNNEKDDPVSKVHILGGIPDLPPKNVIRKQMLTDVQSELKNLKNGCFLVLHGMVGCGKTSLTVLALRNEELVKDTFKEQIYWLTVGPEGVKDPLFLLKELNVRLPDPLDLGHTSPKLASIELAKRFDERNWCDGLIVLDDVTDGSILDFFNFGPKILITTRHENIISGHRKSKTTFLKVAESFSLPETQQLFSQALQIDDVSSLSFSTIPKIWELTKGHPFTLSLIVNKFAEKFEEDLLNKKDRWNYIIDTVLSEKGDRRKSWSYSDMYESSIQLSVDSLQKDEEECFYKLAVFLQDVNIKPEVLGTLWSVNKHRAEEIMVGFVNKSLAVRKWSKPQLSYVYGVHDLIADFLARKMIKKEKLLHENFISQYEKLSNNDWSKLPINDNYIFYYIGYHLMKAGRTEDFQKAYFDLEFLQAKLRVSGPADVISDFKKYQDYILNGDDSLKIKLKSYSTFIEDFGVYISQGIDVIQAALQTQSTSPVYEAGISLAKNRGNHHHYIHCSSPKEKIIPSSLALKENSGIVTLCFGSSLNQVIIAMENNSILLYDFKTKHIIRRYEGHTSRISCLNMSPCTTKFLSTSHDCSIKIWTLPNSQDGHTTPPQERQNNYVSFFDVENNRESPEEVLKHNHEVLFAVFSEDVHMLASICLKGTITLRKNGQMLWKNRYFHFKSIDFLSDKRILAANDKEIFVMNRESGQIIQKFSHSEGTKGFLRLKTISSKEVPSFVLVGTNGIIMFKENEKSPDNVINLPVGLKIANFCSIGSNIAVSSEENNLYVLRPDNGAIITYLPSQNRNIVSWCVGDNAILAGDKDSKVLFYPLEALSSPFTCVKWVAGMDPVLASVDNTHSLIKVIIGGRSYCKITEDTEKMDVSQDGKALVTCSKNGIVLYLRQDTEEVHEILTHKILPCSIFLLSALDEHIVLLSYAGKEGVLMWRSTEKTTKKLGDSISAVEYAELINYDLQQCIVTAPPFTLWTLNGEKLSRMELNGIYCISPSKERLAVLTTSGVDLFTFRCEKFDKIPDDSRHIKLIAFSPSGNKCALMDENGTLKVFDCDEKKLSFFPEDPIVKKSISLAISDSGTVCYGGDGLLSIATVNRITRAVIDPVYISANPDGKDTFAVADKTGGLCLLKECNNEVSNLEV